MFFHQILLGGNPPSFLLSKFCAIQYYKFMNELSDVSCEETSEKQYEDHCEIY